MKYKTRGFTEEYAIRYLSERISKHGKIIHIVAPFNGLKMCSAYDFLVNYCGYKSY